MGIVGLVNGVQEENLADDVQSAGTLPSLEARQLASREWWMGSAWAEQVAGSYDAHIENVTLMQGLGLLVLGRPRTTERECETQEGRGAGWSGIEGARGGQEVGTERDSCVNSKAQLLAEAQKAQKCWFRCTGEAPGPWPTLSRTPENFLHAQLGPGGRKGLACRE